MAAKWWRSGAGTTLRALSFSSSKLSKISYYHTIQAVPREVTGSKISAKERKLGRIPAVILNQNSIGVHKDLRDSDFRKSLVTTEKNEILKIMKSVELPFFCSTRFEIQIRPGPGSKVLLDSGKVLPIKVYRDEKTEEIINLEFVWANEGTELKVDVPVVFKGEDVCPGIVKGGQLKRIRTSLRLVGPAELIPPMFEVDVSNLDLGDHMLFSDLGVDSSLKLFKENDKRPICKLVSTKLEASPESA